MGSIIPRVSIKIGLIIFENISISSFLNSSCAVTMIDALTFGISNTNSVVVDGSASNGDFAKFTANGLEGRTLSELKSDLALTHSDIDLSSYSGSSSITTTGTITSGTWQGTIVYKQQSQGANYEHKIRGPLSGYLDTELNGNSVAYIKVQTTGTGTNDAYCYYRWSQDGENAGATLTHIHGNSGNNSNRPYMVLDGQHPCWKTAHSTQYNFIIRV